MGENGGCFGGKLQSNFRLFSYYLEIAGRPADSVSAAHEKGIVHWDLKPDNLMLSDDGWLKDE